MQVFKCLLVLYDTVWSHILLLVVPDHGYKWLIPWSTTESKALVSCYLLLVMGTLKW